MKLSPVLSMVRLYDRRDELRDHFHLKSRHLVNRYLLIASRYVRNDLGS